MLFSTGVLLSMIYNRGDPNFAKVGGLQIQGGKGAAVVNLL